MKPERQHSLLYRYFFFTWLFRDASRGNWLERSAAWRYNKAHAHWLLIYLKRWLVVDGLALAGATFTSLLLQGHWLAIPFFMLLSLAVPMVSVIVVTWLGLHLMPDP